MRLHVHVLNLRVYVRRRRFAQPRLKKWVRLRRRVLRLRLWAQQVQQELLRRAVSRGQLVQKAAKRTIKRQVNRPLRGGRQILLLPLPVLLDGTMPRRDQRPSVPTLPARSALCAPPAPPARLPISATAATAAASARATSPSNDVVRRVLGGPDGRDQGGSRDVRGEAGGGDDRPAEDRRRAQSAARDGRALATT